jgi:hypothetical protein
MKKININFVEDVSSQDILKKLALIKITKKNYVYFVFLKNIILSNYSIINSLCNSGVECFRCLNSGHKILDCEVNSS